jgi:hypothetical protein
MLVLITKEENGGLVWNIRIGLLPANRAHLSMPGMAEYYFKTSMIALITSIVIVHRNVSASTVYLP